MQIATQFIRFVSITIILQIVTLFLAKNIFFYFTTFGKPIDLAVVFLFFFPIFIASKSEIKFFLFEFVVFLVVYLVNAKKILFMEIPVRVYDLASVSNVFFSLPPIYGTTLVTVTVVLAYLFISNINFKKRGALFFGVASYVVCITLTVTVPTKIKQVYDYYELPMEQSHKKMLEGIIRDDTYTPERFIYYYHGAFAYIYGDLIKKLVFDNSTPSREEVQRAVNTLYDTQRITPNFSRAVPERNVFVIAIESLVDITQFVDKRSFNRDLFDERFRKLLNESNDSHSVSLQICTGNGIFELLCGFPIMWDTVPFYDNLNVQLPCMPQYMNMLGYQTHFYEKVPPYAFNEGVSVPKTGMQTTYFQDYWNDMNTKDIVHKEDRLEDALLYKKALKDIKSRLGKEKGFYFLMSTTTHYPFKDYGELDLVDKIIPDQKVSQELLPCFTDYINTVYHATKFAMDFVEELQKLDPDALIVITGDHYAINFNIEARQRDTLNRLSVPLVIIDGRNGVLKDMSQPHNQLAKTIFDILKVDVPIYDYPEDLYRYRFRWSKDYYINVETGKVCDDSMGANCDGLSDELKSAYYTLFVDMFYGEQYGKEFIPGFTFDDAKIFKKSFSKKNLDRF